MVEVLDSLATKYQKLYGFEFNEQKFLPLYEDMIKHVYSKDRELCVISPLENFELSGVSSLSINDYRIRKLTDWEMEQLIGIGYQLDTPFSPAFGEIETLYCIERIIRVPKRSTPPLEPFMKEFMTALRLFKNGATGYAVLLSYSRIWKSGWGATFHRRRKFDVGPKYILSKEETSSFIDHFRQFIRAKDEFSNNIKFSLRWFNKSYEEHEILDRILDLAIAIEVLYNSSDRLDLYVPHFLESSKEKRMELSGNIKKLRKLRGAIVHSGSCGVDTEFLNMIESIFRLSMQKLLKLLPETNYETILKDIRASLLE